MNSRLIIKTLGLLLLCEAGAMVPSLLMAFFIVNRTSLLSW